MTLEVTRALFERKIEPRSYFFHVTMKNKPTTDSQTIKRRREMLKNGSETVQLEF